MDFLKAILGDDLYNQVSSKVNEYNGNDENKDKQIKIANLASGEYVGKGKYDALQTELDGTNGKLSAANALIDDLKKAGKGNEELQGKITGYESKVAELQSELEKTKLDYALKLGLVSEKVLDVDYLTFKLKEKGEKLELDENGKIKGWEDKISALKTQFPNQFSKADDKKVDPLKLPDNDGASGESAPKSLAEALKLKYESS